jgi:hypothetical protein
VDLKYPLGYNGYSLGPLGAQGRYFVEFHSDVIATENWLGNLMNCITSDSRIGAVVAACNESSNDQEIPVSYEKPEKNDNEMQRFAKEYNHPDPTKWEDKVRLMPTSGYMIPTALYRLLLRDPWLYYGHFTDDDMSIFLRRGGFRQILAKDTFLHHFGSQTSTRDIEENDSLKRMGARFYEKWGVDAWKSSFFNAPIVHYIKHTETNGSKSFLFINPQFGVTPINIFNDYRKKGEKVGETAAIVSDRRYGADAVYYDKTLVGGLVESLEKLHGKYDYIIFHEDVEEYVGSEFPKLLKALHKRCKPESKVLFTLNNPSYYKKLFELLNGSASAFPYEHEPWRGIQIDDPQYVEKAVAENGFHCTIGYVPGQQNEQDAQNYKSMSALAEDANKAEAMRYWKLFYELIPTPDTRDKFQEPTVAGFREAESKPHRIEAVFISYKASMSDSIESIYHAAKADPDCDAYWIPIPYYDRNRSGSIGEAYIEAAGHYDASIDITDWRSYDMETRRPDMIFTFSPYDSSNYITSIHPNYYCEKLKSYTDLLIYVPYFLDIDEGTTENYCLLPACMFADKTVLSTEKMRDTYIRVFNRMHGNSFGKPEDKFVALGSPKYDKAINTKRIDCGLPSEWEKMICDKKVVTYVSSVGCALDTWDTYLDKLCRILETFYRHSDALLWWRPHPLMEATLGMIRPELLSRYKEIVSAYKNECRGIYDDTSDLHRAIAWSDAFYGDWSSLLLLYQVAGKPVMMADTTAHADRLKAGLVDCRHESKKDTLEQYISDVVIGERSVTGIQGIDRGIVNADGTAGKAIYEYAKHMLRSGAKY